MPKDRNQDLQAILIQSSTTYPKVVNLRKPVAERINNILRETAYAAIPDYQPGSSIMEAQSGYTTPVNMNGILSVRFQNHYYPEKAAHGVTGVSSVTLNIETGHFYNFDELFRAGSNYAAVINQIIQEQITARQIPMLKPFEGIGPNEMYYLTPDSLVIYYQPYVYTPGYVGVLEFTIPYQQIASIIDPNGPIGKIVVPAGSPK